MHHDSASVPAARIRTLPHRLQSVPPQSVFLCRTDLVALDRLLDILAHRFLCFSSISLCLVIPTCGRLSWPALWSAIGAL